MLSRKQRQQVSASLMVLFVVVSLFPVSLAAASGQAAPPPDNETFEVTDQVNAWERSFLPLRADATNAAETVSNADWRVRSPGGQETNLNRDPMAVYETGSAVDLSFDLSNTNANSEAFGNEEVEVLRVHLEEGSENEVPDTFSGALDLVQETANENAGYKEVSDGETLDANGDLSVEDTPDESGQYFYVVAMKESGDGFTVSDGDLRIDGEVTIIGMEQITVQKSAATVSHPDNVTRGDTVAFDVDAPSIEGDTVRQAIVLYDEEKYVTQSFVVDVSEPVSSDFDPTSDTVLETTVDEVNGVASVNASIGAMGLTIGDGEVARSADIASLMDFVGEKAGPGAPMVDDLSSDTVVLDASTTVVQRSSGETTIDVETLGNWSTGDYRWAYVAVGDDSQEIATETGHVTVEKEGKDGDGDDGDGDDGDDGDTGDGDDGDDGDKGDGDDGDDGDKGDGDDGDDGDTGDGDDGDTDDGDDGDDGDDNNAGGGGGGGGVDDGDGADDECEVDPAVSTSGDASNAAVDCVEPGSEIPVDDINLTNGVVTLDQLNVTATNASSNVSINVAMREGPTGSVPPLTEAANPLGYFEVNTTNLTSPHESPGTFTFRVSNETLQDRDIPPEDVVLYRYNDDAWQTIETTHLGDDRYRATTPGFSLFAVGTRYASVSVTGTALSATEIEAGETVDVTVTVENAGNKAGTMSVPITVNGEQRASPTISVDGGDSASETVSLTFETAGEYEIVANGTNAGTVTVSGVSPGTTTDSPGDGTDTPGTVPPATTAPGFQENTTATTAGPDGDNGGDFPLIILGIVVILAVIAGTAYYLRNQ